MTSPQVIALQDLVPVGARVEMAYEVISRIPQALHPCSINVQGRRPTYSYA